MNGYSQTFTLTEIFNNKKLRDLLPLVNYKEKTDENGKTHRTTNVKSVPMTVLYLARQGAKGHFRPIKSTKSGDYIEIGGNIVTDYETAYESVYNAIYNGKELLSATANNVEMIRTAIKTTKKQGKEPKLYLRVGSMLQIEQMSNGQIRNLLNNVMENIYYNPEFGEVQKKMKINEIPTADGLPYYRRQENWQRRVGL